MLSYVFGAFIIDKARSFFTIDSQVPEEISLVCLFGLIPISVIAAVFSLWMPVAGFVALFLIVLAFVFLWIDRSKWLGRLNMHWQHLRCLPWYVMLFLGYSLLVMLYLSSQQSMSADEGGYYAETIRWLESYRVIPGLVNVHDRLAFNSHWHMLSAVFNFSFLTKQESNQINGFLYFVIAVFFFQKLYAPMFVKFGVLVGVLLVFMNLPHPFLAYYVIAPNADYVVMLISWVIFLLMIEKSIKNNWAEIDHAALLIFSLSFFVMTLKVSALTMLACPLMLLIWQRRKGARSLFPFSVILGFVILVPWLIRNVVLSGYLVFPLHLDVFSFDWAYPTQRLLDLNEYIRTCAFNLYKPGRAESASLPFIERYSNWFLHNLRFHEQGIIVLAFLSIPTHFIVWKRQSKEMQMLLLLIFASMLLWLLKAPDPRFGYAFLMFSCAASFQIYFAKLNRAVLLIAVFAGAFAFQVGGVLLYWYFEKQFTKVEHRHTEVKQASILLMPKPYEYAATDSVLLLNEGLRLNLVQDTVPYLWAMDLPATGTLYNGLQQRGKDIESGFQIKSP